MSATTRTTSLPAEIADVLEDLTGFHPILDRAVAALAELATADLTADQSMNLIAALSACNDGNLRGLTAVLVRHIGDPDANPALTGLDDDRKQMLRRLGAEHAAAVTEADMNLTASEMAAVIDSRGESR